MGKIKLILSLVLHLLLIATVTRSTQPATCGWSTTDHLQTCRSTVQTNNEDGILETETWTISSSKTFTDVEIDCTSSVVFSNCITVESGIEVEMNDTIITGNLKGRCIEIGTNAKLTLNNVTLTNCGGESVERGGAIRSHDGSIIHITDSKFTGNRVAGRGGGIYTFDTTLTVIDSIFESNNAEEKADGTDGRGGGVYIRNGTDTMTRTLFKDNTAKNKGGGMYAWNSLITINTSNFTGNKVENDGGGLVSYRSALDVVSSLFESNEAVEPVETDNHPCGGGVYVSRNHDDGSMVTFTDCTFDQNTATYKGGGISAYYANMSIINGQITKNTAKHGGGLSLFYCPLVKINFSSIEENEATTGGGGLYVSGMANATIPNYDSVNFWYTDFTGNIAEIDSNISCLSSNPGKLLIRDSDISDIDDDCDVTIIQLG